MKRTSGEYKFSKPSPRQRDASDKAIEFTEGTKRSGRSSFFSHDFIEAAFDPFLFDISPAKISIGIPAVRIDRSEIPTTPPHPSCASHQNALPSKALQCIFATPSVLSTLNSSPSDIVIVSAVGTLSVIADNPTPLAFRLIVGMEAGKLASNERAYDDASDRETRVSFWVGLARDRRGGERRVSIPSSMALDDSGWRRCCSVEDMLEAALHVDGDLVDEVEEREEDIEEMEGKEEVDMPLPFLPCLRHLPQTPSAFSTPVSSTSSQPLECPGSVSALTQ